MQFVFGYDMKKKASQLSSVGLFKHSTVVLKFIFTKHSVIKCTILNVLFFIHF